jgi:hypothetical protein
MRGLAHENERLKTDLGATRANLAQAQRVTGETLIALATAKGQIQNLMAELARAQTELKTAEQRRGAITLEQRRVLFAALHPDQATDPTHMKRLAEAFKIVNNLTVIRNSNYLPVVEN